MRVSYLTSVIVALIATSAIAGIVSIDFVPVETSLDGYSDESKAVFKDCLAALRNFTAALDEQAGKDSDLAITLRSMPNQEIERRATKYNGVLMSIWELSWPKVGDDTAPIRMSISYQSSDFGEDHRRKSEKAGSQWLATPRNNLAILYSLKIENLRVRGKVEDALKAAFSPLSKAQNGVKSPTMRSSELPSADAAGSRSP